ncbi:T9SS C-terminal target domain-containing protein [Bacteroides sp. 214]|uniref:T9SS type A sorting domain-containing protein n=1 Tax=Bacteroides sp. 214 TaxID=2302935 RepID=UPI0013D26A57|nr:T9SS type A sorting domain-containing protein [Bacteroides sp. 214]NDW13231.1 T9SS C-terminal target domain-containing protein [Bacteroides sp. 214]
MRKITLYFFLLITFASAPALFAQQPQKSEVIKEEQPKALVTVHEKVVSIENATVGSVVEIYNILGVKVFSFTIESAKDTFTIDLPKGFYILKIGRITKKIAI